MGGVIFFALGGCVMPGVYWGGRSYSCPLICSAARGRLACGEVRVRESSHAALCLPRRGNTGACRVLAAIARSLTIEAEGGGAPGYTCSLGEGIDR
jgi:hypothetical protein